MANRLKMAKIDAIVVLHQRKWSIRRISKELGIHRDTVARHIRDIERSSNQVGALIGVSETAAMPREQAGDREAALLPNQAGAPIGSDPSASEPERQSSLCEPWRQIIIDKLEAGLTAQRIFQDLINDHQFPGQYHSVRRFVRRLGQGQPLPFRRLECAAGEEAQVDFGTGIPITLPGGKRRRTHVFRIV